jgi:putative aldouronate transport system permease protein
MVHLQTKGERAFKIFAAIILVLITLCAFLPFMLIVIASITEENSLIKYGYTYFPKKLSLDAYRYMVANSYMILRSYGVSILVTLVGTATSLLLTTTLAYPISRKDFKYHNVLAFLVFFTMLFSGGIVPSFVMWTRIFHIKDTLLALIIPSYLVSAMNVLLVKNYYSNNIPHAIIESAQIDGASELAIFRKIMLPLSTPVIVTVGLFTGLAYWNDWINALYYINKPQLYGIQNLLIRIMNNIQFITSAEGSNVLGGNVVQVPTVGIRMSMAVVGILPIVISFPFLQKYLTEGIIIGAVKG